jgi:hypothetical protein
MDSARSAASMITLSVRSHRTTRFCTSNPYGEAVPLKPPKLPRFLKRGKQKDKETDEHAPQPEQPPREEALRPAESEASPVPPAPQPPPGASIDRKTRRAAAKAERKAKHDSDKAAHQLCRELRKELKRPVIPVDERPRDQAVRQVLEHRRAIIGLGVLGTSIATVCTAGTAAGALAIVAACLPAADFRTFFDTETHDPNRGVRLQPDAVSLLLEDNDAADRAAKLQAAVNAAPDAGSGGMITLSAEDIRAAIAPKPKHPILDIRIAPVRAGVRMGLTVFGGGLLLLALTIIPDDIHGLMIKVASAILVVGALMVGAAVTNGSWLTGLGRLGHDAGQAPAALTGDGNHSPF